MLYQTAPLALGALLFVVLSISLRRTVLRSSYLLLPAAAWFLAALDEWYMSTFHPEMNIRVDALLFLVLMAALTPAGIVLTLSGKFARR